MNIFILGYDLKSCVESCVDRHASKMVLETAQLLCTSLNLLGIETPYRSSHRNHPCRLWSGLSRGNFEWLCEYGAFISEEFKYRYKKCHKSGEVIKFCSKYISRLPAGDRTPFAQAMPEEYKCNDPVLAYRNYYNGKKRHLFKWTGRPVPEWIVQ